jgi:hypothetical protein
MNVEPEEIGPEVPEADALEQRTPALPESTGELTEINGLPGDVPQPDFIEQRTDVQPGSAGYERIAATQAEAAEADLIDQATDLSSGAEDEYPDAAEEPGR